MFFTAKHCSKKSIYHIINNNTNEISDKAISYPHCGYPMKHPTPYYPDIEIHHTIDDDWYYDTKNHREISFGEYLTAKKEKIKKQ